MNEEIKKKDRVFRDHTFSESIKAETNPNDPPNMFLEKERKKAYLQGVRDMWLNTKTSIGSQTIYLRSKFSRDNSRGETEEEKNTEMIVRKQTMEILDSKARQFIDSLEKGTTNE